MNSIYTIANTEAHKLIHDRKGKAILTYKYRPIDKSKKYEKTSNERTQVTA